MLRLTAFYLKKYATHILSKLNSLHNIILDEEGNILTWNSELQNLEGYTYDEIIGKNIRLFYPAEDLTCLECEKLLGLARQKGSCRQFGQFCRKDGHKYWGILRITAIRKGEKQVLGFIARWQKVR